MFDDTTSVMVVAYELSAYNKRTLREVPRPPLNLGSATSAKTEGAVDRFRLLPGEIQGSFFTIPC